MTVPTAELPMLLRVPEVAEFLRVSSRTVERLIDTGAFDGGVVRFRGSVRIRRDALMAFVDAHS